MAIRRVVPNIPTANTDPSFAFYQSFLGFEVGMDMDWIVTFTSPDNPTAQVSVLRAADHVTPFPNLSVEVDDVDRLYAEAVERGLEIVYKLTDEPWGVRRFFVRDPNGVVVNIVGHI